MKRLQAVIFDWPGTAVNHDSPAPVKAVSGLFARNGIVLRDTDARRDLGLFKKDHIRRILALPPVERGWRTEKGSPPDEPDVEALFGDLAQIQMEIPAAHSQLISGMANIAERLLGRGMKIGSTTGYARHMLNLLLARAAEQGYTPDAALCPDDTGGGRPYPWMCVQIALGFRPDATSAAVKVGDTVSDIKEGLNAGMWAVGVSATGNEVGRSAADWEAPPAPERRQLSCRAAEKLQAAGAHYEIEGVGRLEPVLEEIDDRLSAGERP